MQVSANAWVVIVGIFWGFSIATLEHSNATLSTPVTASTANPTFAETSSSPANTIMIQENNTVTAETLSTSTYTNNTAEVIFTESTTTHMEEPAVSVNVVTNTAKIDTAYLAITGIFFLIIAVIIAVGYAIYKVMLGEEEARSTNRPRTAIYRQAQERDVELALND